LSLSDFIFSAAWHSLGDLRGPLLGPQHSAQQRLLLCH